VKVDSGLGGENLRDVPRTAREQEAAGYDGLWSAETKHDSFLPLLLAAEHTDRVELGTSIAVAFARNPMTLATLSDDLQRFSAGRFVLGLGSQIRPHIEKRFSMPWSHPAPRMRELILAIRAIWRAWETGDRLDFRGEFYTHTLMTPFFDPGPNPHGNPKIFLAAVGERMTEVAGEVADGLLVHGFTTERYLREVTLPAVQRGLARSGRARAAFSVSYPGLVVTGDDEEQMAAAAAGTRAQIAFYASTPAYRGVLELHGWGGLGDELNRLSKSSRPDKWAEMGRLVDDEVLTSFAVVAEPAQVPARIRERFGDLVDRFSFSAPYAADERKWRAALAALKG
jgi:probable F420-dependent oxidoreductase